MALGGLVGRTGGSRGGAERLQRADTRREAIMPTAGGARGTRLVQEDIKGVIY